MRRVKRWRRLPRLLEQPWLDEKKAGKRSPPEQETVENVLPQKH